jgi:hypothetical protein
MGIEQIQSAKTKALLPVFQFNWSQMESSRDASKQCPNSTFPTRDHQNRMMLFKRHSGVESFWF